MAKEIERKFLIETIPSDVKIIGSHRITQNYLVTGDEEIRIRYKGEQNEEPDLTLTIKRGSGLEREEITNVISLSTYDQLNSGCSHSPIAKERLLIQDGEFILEIDKYENKQLIVAEVEFDTIESANTFTPPSWFGEEVTTDANYKNQNLWKKWQTI